MKHKILGQLLSPLEKDNHGFITIILVVIICAILSVITIKVALTKITQLEITEASLSGLASQRLAEGCLQDALIQLNRNNSYAGGILAIGGGGSCVVSISGVGNTRTISVTGNLNNYYHTLTVDATLAPFEIITWDN